MWFGTGENVTKQLLKLERSDFVRSVIVKNHEACLDLQKCGTLLDIRKVLAKSDRAQHAPELFNRPIAKGDQSFTGTWIDVLKCQATSARQGRKVSRLSRSPPYRHFDAAVKRPAFLLSRAHHAPQSDGDGTPFLRASCPPDPTVSRPATWHVLAPSDLFAGALEPGAVSRRPKDAQYQHRKQI